MLLQCFLIHAPQFGFFLDPERFYESAFVSPAEEVHGPSPGLLSVVCLWGVHLSQCSIPGFSEPDLLRRSRRYISIEISADGHPANILHTIQALVLLATYLFRNNSLREAELHANSAATLVVACGLHKLRSARESCAGNTTLLDDAPPRDAIEEGERIRGFWAVAFLQTGLGIAFESHRGCYVLESPSVDIDTPWPLEIVDYEEGLLPPDYLGQGTVRHLIMDDRFPASPICMLQAKASVLFHHVSRVPAFGNNDWGSSGMTTSSTWLAMRISQFWESLPPLHVFGAETDRPAARALALAHAFTAAATITLHRRANASENSATAVAAARLILESLQAGDSSDTHPVWGGLFALACNVLLGRVRALRAFREALAAELGLGTLVSTPTAEEEEIVADLRNGFATMAVYAGESEVIGHRLKLLLEQYGTI